MEIIFQSKNLHDFLVQNEFFLSILVEIIDVVNFRVFAFQIRTGFSGSRGHGPYHGSALDHEGDPC